MKKKTFNCGISVLLLALAFAVMPGCATGPAMQPMTAANSGRLVITRSFDLAGLPVALIMDGKRIATLEFNRRYDAPIAPGPHTIGVQQIPESERTRSAPIQLVVQPGQTYRFTAMRAGPEVTLR
jgi:hypothetical protein